jgi:hypothetical protein
MDQPSRVRKESFVNSSQQKLNFYQRTNSFDVFKVVYVTTYINYGGEIKII